MDKDSKRRLVWPYLLAMILLVVAYPLSIGPIGWLHRKGFLGRNDETAVKMMVAFYRPYTWIVHNNSTAADLHNAYISLWSRRSAP